MKYTNLAKNPEKYNETIALIENAFNYSSTHSFDVDFYPLMHEGNRENCHILIINDTVVAHVGLLKKQIKVEDMTSPVFMYGGIAVSKSYRGQGLFKKLFSKVLEDHEDCSLHLLWSDRLNLYKNFSFYPAIEQIEIYDSLEDAQFFIPTKLKSLSKDEIKQLSHIYNNAQQVRVSRSEKDWEILKHIESTDLYIKKENDSITNYFFMNKGEDLSGVIFEVGDFKDIEEIQKFGIIWSPYTFGKSDIEHQYASVVRIGDVQLFSELVHNYTKNIITIKNLDSGFVYFDFENTRYKLAVSDFLTGIFGPGRFEELRHCPPIYISGLDSI